MRLLVSCLVLVTLAAGLANAAIPLISRHGAGPIRVGMSYEAAKPAISGERHDGEGPATCRQYDVKGYPALMFMVEEHRVTRVTAYGPGLATPEGIEVGDPEAKVLKAYGRRLHRFDPDYGEGHALFVTDADGGGLLFWIDYRGDVAAIHAGEQSIRYEEGCA